MRRRWRGNWSWWWFGAVTVHYVSHPGSRGCIAWLCLSRTLPRFPGGFICCLFTKLKNTMGLLKCEGRTLKCITPRKKVTGLRAVQFGDNWIIPRVVKIGPGRRTSLLWLMDECLELSYFQIGVRSKRIISLLHCARSIIIVFSWPSLPTSL